MQMEREQYAIRDVLELFRNGMLRANPEYQRGTVWSKAQKKKLIDSVLRGYPLPLIYLHHIKKSVAGMQREDLEIVDGQQRINALFEFVEGAYALFDPISDEAEAKFPAFIKQQACEWGKKDFGSLTHELRDALLATQLSVVKVTTDNANEIRDLFIRLQAGLPLNAQEARDAWPSQFGELILRVGGKPQLARYPGHQFFRRVMRMKPDADRGKTRQLAAQIAALFFARRHDNGKFIDISSRSVDDVYYANLDFDIQSDVSKRFVSVLDKLDQLLGNGKRPALKGHDAIHLVLLVDALWDDYTRSWEDRLPDALDAFLHELAKAKKTREAATPSEYWTQYGQWTRVNSDRADRIAHRHEFYLGKMLELLKPTPKDPTRGFGMIEREIIYFRDKKRCAVCTAVVAWSDGEIHHVVEHSKGGTTTINNGVLVHQKCHPKGQAALEFAEAWRGPRAS
jgi:hypothetical protein